MREDFSGEGRVVSPLVHQHFVGAQDIETGKRFGVALPVALFCHSEKKGRREIQRDDAGFPSQVLPNGAQNMRPGGHGRREGLGWRRFLPTGCIDTPTAALVAASAAATGHPDGTVAIQTIAIQGAHAHARNRSARPNRSIPTGAVLVVSFLLASASEATPFGINATIAASLAWSGTWSNAGRVHASCDDEDWSGRAAVVWHDMCCHERE